MRSLVILALLGCAYAAPFLQYTPEVVAERARFQQLYNAAAAAAAAAPDPVPSAPQRAVVTHQAVSHTNAPATFTTAWRGPVAATIPAGLPGSGPNVADTSDVSAARDAFLAAYRAQVTATTGQKFPAPIPTVHSNTIAQAPTPVYRWTGPVAATVPAGVNGKITPVGETAEVAAARNAFNAAYDRAVAATVQTAPQNVVFQAPQPSHVTFSAMPTQQISHAPQPKWNGPVAATIPAGLPGSVAQVGPTAEVAAATQAFNQAYGAAVAATTGRRF